MCFCMLSLHLTVGVKRDRKWGKETRGITRTKWLRLPGFEPVQGIRILTRPQGHHFLSLFSYLMKSHSVIIMKRVSAKFVLLLL